MRRKLFNIIVLLLMVTQGAWAQETTQWTFSYTGGIQTFTAPHAGIYSLQVWGAQGGSFNNSENNGGLGGYATCRTTLTQGETIYVYVGGQGGSGTKSGPGAGGWNGGGAGGSAYSTNYCSSGGGGGATHISKVNNQVIGDGCNFLGGTNYIIVAGGGGGAGHPWTTPGAGGGTEGGKGTRWNSSSQSTYSDYYYYSTSQSCGANGGNSSIADQFDAEGAGGGGAGYYGGTSNYPYGSFPNVNYTNASGCGGNSACNSSFATDFSTTAGQREGNGQAQIIFLVSQDEIDAHVGKVLGSDGKMYKTVAAAENAGVTASGIIAYWGVAGSVEDGNSTYRGMAIAIEDAVLRWGNYPDHTNYCSSDNHQCSTATSYCSSVSEALNAINGIAATESAQANNINHWHNGPCNGYDVVRPSGASMWAIPSIGQWKLMVQGLTGNSSDLSATDNPDYNYSDNLNTKINAAGGNGLQWLFYWSSTEKDASNAWIFNVGGKDGTRNGSRVDYYAKKTDNIYTHVRMFFAFSSATAAVYSISYDANGGSGAPSLQTKDGGIDLTLSTTVPTRTGYTFAGWTVAQDGSGTVYDAGTAYDGNEDVTLYAQWTENTATLSQATDNSTFISTNNELVYDITLTRTLNPGGWNTFCAPFNISSSQITSIFGAGTKVRELGSSDYDSTTKSLTLNFTNAESIDAGKPYLVYLGSGSAVSNPTFEDVTIVDGTTTTTTTYVDFVPVMSPTELTAGDKTVLFVTGGNALTYPNTTGNLNGFRAYFQLHDLPNEARSFEMNLDDETTGIETMSDVSHKMSNVYFTLDGRHLSGKPSKKGVYILNGIKVIVK